jgi:hypothetical protein
VGKELTETQSRRGAEARRDALSTVDRGWTVETVVRNGMYPSLAVSEDGRLQVVDDEVSEQVKCGLRSPW